MFCWILVFSNIDAFSFSRIYINVPNSFLQGDHVSNTILCVIHGFSMGWCHEVCTIRSSCDELEKSTSQQSADRKMHGKSRRLVDALSSKSQKDEVESTKKYPTLINLVQNTSPTPPEGEMDMIVGGFPHINRHWFYEVIKDSHTVWPHVWSLKILQSTNLVLTCEKHFNVKGFFVFPQILPTWFSTEHLLVQPHASSVRIPGLRAGPFILRGKKQQPIGETKEVTNFVQAKMFTSRTQSNLYQLEEICWARDSMTARNVGWHVNTLGRIPTCSPHLHLK